MNRFKNIDLRKPAMKASKYRNVKVEVGGVKFHSKKEAKRYGELKMLEKAGLIEELELQPKFEIWANGTKICSYISDFRYVEYGTTIVEDLKSEATKKLPVYRLKIKLLKAIYGIEIKEI